jgi:hypothetical protein
VFGDGAGGEGGVEVRVWVGERGTAYRAHGDIEGDLGGGWELFKTRHIH